MDENQRRGATMQGGMRPPLAESAGGAETAQAAPERLTDEAFEPLFAVLLHNDDVTPYEYVLQILQRIFTLSDELAEHIAWTAHNEGQAIVIVRPRAEAKRLVMLAHNRARADGYPLAFTVEPQPQ